MVFVISAKTHIRQDVSISAIVSIVFRIKAFLPKLCYKRDPCVFFMCYENKINMVLTEYTFKLSVFNLYPCYNVSRTPVRSH